MAYRIVHDTRASKQIKNLDRQIMRRVMSRIDELADNPRPHGFTPLEGHEKLYRIRVGDYRIVYRIDDVRELVEIALVAHRREVYRDL
jgi:mRNA interferase RelE/StbE